MSAFFDLSAWAGWIRAQDEGWLFLLILLLVVAVVALWSRSLKPDKTKESTDRDTDRTENV